MGVRLVFLFLNQRVIFIIFSCEIQKSLHIITDIFSFFPNHTDFNKERRFNGSCTISGNLSVMLE